MFGLIKILLFLGVIATAWFSYDFYTHLTSKDAQALKSDAKDLLDSGQYTPLFQALKVKMSDDFEQRFWPKLKKAFNVLNEDTP